MRSNSIRFWLLAVLVLFTANAVYAQMSGGLPPLKKTSPSKSSAPQATQAQTIELLGQRITFTNPTGYCTPGESVPERDLMTMSKNLIGPGARLVHVAILCSELEAFRDGRREFLDHWIHIQLIGPKGDFKRLEMGREAFLTGVSKDSPRLDAAKINRQIQSALESPDVSLSNMQVVQLGRDGNAVYMSTRMTLNVGDRNRLVTGLGGITLLNSLPLTVIVYEATGQAKSREQQQPILQQLLTSLLTKN
jgi:hypothetical protein